MTGTHTYVLNLLVEEEEATFSNRQVKLHCNHKELYNDTFCKYKKE